jgi:ATP-dependent DNA helicase RecG
LSAKKLLGDAVSPRTGRPYRLALLTGSLDERTKRETQGRAMRGEAQLVIGTHALQEDKADFANLGLVIVDEQHRFGVQQRFKLMRKPGADGRVTDPDVLAMTATPIPRTLALTVYGDLEVSVIDEMPPGRTPIVTRRTTGERAGEAWEFVRKQVTQGRQAYIVYPVIEGAKDDQPELDFAKDAAEESEEQLRAAKGSRGKGNAEKLFAEKAKLRSATEMFDELRAGALKGLRLGLLHGRLSADEKEVTMARFKRGEIDVLVATTVIEVGVDVANASVMVIEHAERFGLAQMHQLRGRVGRGAEQSYCILVTSRMNDTGRERIRTMTESGDGFYIAEMDLKLRGPGEFFGTKQSGLPALRIANIIRDLDVLEIARGEAQAFIANPPSQEELRRAVSYIQLHWQRQYGLVQVG